MEEKKATTLSLTTFLLILAIIIIVIMGVFIFKLNSEKTAETGKIDNLNNEISSLQGTINQLQGKIDIISNTINSNTSITNLSSNVNNSSTIENSTTSTEKVKPSNKEIYKKVKTIDSNEIGLNDDYTEKYIVLEGNSIYFSNNLSDKIYEGTYKVDSKNNIDYKTINETQDYAFYTASIFRFETINGKKNIIVDNGPDEMMYFEKIN